MVRRYLLLLPVAAFAVLGGVGYVAGMPKPGALVSEHSAVAAPAPASVTVIGDATGADDESRPAADQDWVLRTGAATGIPVRALEAYATAAYSIGIAQPDCNLGWNTLAAIGDVESAHGALDGSAITDAGLAEPAIFGPALNGDGVAAVPDTDRGGYDGDSTWDRAVGPLQFIPATWASYGVDADLDGIANPQDIDDAALTAAYLLCQSGDLSTTEGWGAAIFAYNHLDTYVQAVRDRATSYAEQSAVEG